MKIIRFRDNFEIKAPEQVTRLDTKEKIKMIDSYLSGINTLRVSVAGSHAGRITRNNALYLPAKMSTGIRSMLSREDGGTSAFAKPVLVNHNRTVGNVPDMSRDPIGRIRGAEYVSLVNNYGNTNVSSIIQDTETIRPDWQYVDMIDVLMKDGILYKKDFQGLGFAKVMMEITDEDAIKKFLDGRYCTVSTSATSNRAICSVCKEDWADLGEPCDHHPGEWYDSDGVSEGTDQKCFLIAGDLAYEEISTATKPADDEAIVLEMEGEVKTPGIHTSKLNDSYQPYEIMAGIQFKDSFDPEGGHNMESREELINKLKVAFESHSEKLDNLSEDITDEVLSGLVGKEELTEEEFLSTLNLKVEDIAPEVVVNTEVEVIEPVVEPTVDFSDSIERAVKSGKITQEEATMLYEVVNKTVENVEPIIPEVVVPIEDIVPEEVIVEDNCVRCNELDQKLVDMSEQRESLSKQLNILKAELSESKNETELLIKELSDSFVDGKKSLVRNIAFMRKLNDTDNTFEDICNEIGSKTLKDLKNIHKELHDKFDFANIRSRSDKTSSLPDRIKDPTLSVNDEHNALPSRLDRTRDVIKRYRELSILSINDANAYLQVMKNKKFVSKDFNIEDYLKQDEE